MHRVRKDNLSSDIEAAGMGGFLLKLENLWLKVLETTLKACLQVSIRVSACLKNKQSKAIF